MPNYKKLIIRLAELYPTIDRSKLVLRYAGLKTDEMTRIAFDAAAQINWMNIVQEVEKIGKLKAVIQTVIDDYDDEQLMTYVREETSITPYTDASRAYKEDLNIDGNKLKQLVAVGKLDDVLKKLSMIGDHLGNDYKNSVILLTGRHTNLNQQFHGGLLKLDDYNFERNRIAHSINYQIDQIDNEIEIQNILNNLTSLQPEFKTVTGLNVPNKSEFEKVIGKRNDIVPIEWLATALERSRMVCKVDLSTGGSGTGFLVKGGYVLTNHHVICKYFPKHRTDCDSGCTTAPFECPKRARILLNYHAGSSEEVIYELDFEDTYIINKELDYALIKVKDQPDKSLATWGQATFETFKIPQVSDLVNIIQHPEGNQKKIAMPDDVISVWPEQNYLYYLADTLVGSSGSPVFNQDWEVVALHHAGKDEEQGGIQINARGEKRAANRGVLIGAILADLKTKGINIE